LSIASNIQWYALIPHKAYSFITTPFLGPFDDVITKFYCTAEEILGFRNPLRKEWRQGVRQKNYKENITIKQER
jgi:hypothetical protein